MISRVLPEVRRTLDGTGFKVVTSNRGACCPEIYAGGQKITRDGVPEELLHGRQSGLFNTGQVFARLVDRQLPYAGVLNQMCYPDDIDADTFDPPKWFLHGLDFLYTFEKSRDSAFESPISDAQSVHYERSAERLPVGYPFPHRMVVSYRVYENIFEIGIMVDRVTKPTPVALTVHPFFRYLFDKSDPASALQLKAKLYHRFDYEVVEGRPPMSFDAPTRLKGAGPYAKMGIVPPDRDHSHISSDGKATIYWNGGPRIEMTDLTGEWLCPIKPLQIWTSAGMTEANMCGVEQGGPANCHWLADNGKMLSNWRMVCLPGLSVRRHVRYELLS